jgi:hypothetical protein
LVKIAENLSKIAENLSKIDENRSKSTKNRYHIIGSANGFRHVHEKAILMVTVPLALLSSASASESKSYFLLSTVATFSLFPLIFLKPETSIKVGLFFCQVSHFKKSPYR